MRHDTTSIQEAMGIVLRELITAYVERHGSTLAHFDRLIGARRGYTSSFVNKPAKDWPLPKHLRLRRLLSALEVSHDDLEAKANKLLEGNPEKWRAS